MNWRSSSVLALVPVASVLACSGASREPAAGPVPTFEPDPAVASPVESATGDSHAACGADCNPTASPAGHLEAVRAGGASAAEPSAERAEATGEAHERRAKAGAPSAKKDDRPRIGALGPHTWIWRKPERSGLAIGKMRIGTSVPLRSPDPIDGPGCKGKWYAIEPRGYVCDDDTATLDLDDPYYKALAFSAPDPGVWPYRYAHSNGAPMYSRVPTPEEWQRAERGFGPAGVWKPLGEWAKGHEELIVDEPIQATDEVPYFLEGGKRSVPGGNYNPAVLVWKTIPAGSMLSYSRAFSMHGRVWLLTPDTMVVPADRVSPMRRSTFRGIHFDESPLRLPIAWNRSKEPLPKLTRRDDGSFVPTGETLAAKTPVEITGEEIKSGGWIYYELRHERGTYVAKTADPKKVLDQPLSITRRAPKLPSGIQPGEKWLEVKIVPGTLTAYVGEEPVFTTLFSPGKGGPPVPGKDHSKYATTQTGFFPIEWKERVATMSNEKGEPKVLWFTDVPHQQYLKAPLAMHVAYWHEDFGKRKSAECVNVSPLDGAWLFQWTAPDLPEGWNAVAPGNGAGRSTPIVVTVH